MERVRLQQKLICDGVETPVASCLERYGTTQTFLLERVLARTALIQQIFYVGTQKLIKWAGLAHDLEIGALMRLNRFFYKHLGTIVEGEEEGRIRLLLHCLHLRNAAVSFS